MRVISRASREMDAHSLLARRASFAVALFWKKVKLMRAFIFGLTGRF
jgi:hypothetical protein